MSNINYIVILTIIILIIIIISLSLDNCINFNNINNIEGFDNKIEKINNEECGIACTMIDGCNAFSFDPKSNNCWISKIKLNGKPLHKLYSHDYKNTFKMCNKLVPLIDDQIATLDDFKYNASYYCKEKKKKTNEVYKNKFKKLKNMQKGLDKLHVNPYDLLIVPWPTFSSTIKPLNYNDVKSFVTNISESDFVTVFTKELDEYLGQYLYQHRCVTNISEEDCLKACYDDDDCVGTEWNLLYIDDDNKIYNNVCCPKREIKRTINRRPQFKNGRYYVKTKMPKEELENHAADKVIII